MNDGIAYGRVRLQLIEDVPEGLDGRVKALSGSRVWASNDMLTRFAFSTTTGAVVIVLLFP